MIRRWSAADELILEEQAAAVVQKIMRGTCQQTLLPVVRRNTRPLAAEDGTTSGPFDLRLVATVSSRPSANILKKAVSATPDEARAAAALYSGVRIRYAV
jgi:hypothetical protein